MSTRTEHAGDTLWLRVALAGALELGPDETIDPEGLERFVDEVDAAADGHSRLDDGRMNREHFSESMHWFGDLSFLIAND